MTDALAITGLSKRFSGFTLDSVSLTLPTGYIMGFVGQNGAGKTTTIRLILNMARRDGGQITVLGLDNIVDEIAVKQEVAVVFDDLTLVDTWRVGDVEKALRGFYSRWDSVLYHNYLTRFELPKDRKIAALSRGMKLKLSLAVALSHDAKLLILDEPTSGLDPVAREELLDILHEYIEDGTKSVFFSTHITSDLDKVADYITVIHGGKIFYSGTKDGLMDAFVLAKGKPEDLSTDLKARLIGLTVSRVDFTGLLPAAQRGFLTPQMVADTPSIDDILVCIAKEAGHHA
ncbi:MAG: ABC transporter ATP-binding protein [Propionibacteriaceae bacterium]|nr:ABC transporter ATP-binding protein [Propionibacteriaceae bacterium]